MKLWLKTIAVILVTASLCSIATGHQFTTEYPFSEKYHYPNVLVVSFTMEAVGNMHGIIDYTVEKGIVKTGMESFNALAEKYRITSLERMFDYVTHPEWNDNGSYIQNIFRVHLESNDYIQQANTALNNDNNTVYAEYEAKQFLLYTPNDPDYHRQWHHPAIQAPEAWRHVRGSREVIVAITDTGAKWNHPDLAANIWINEAELPGITINWAAGQITGGDGIDNDRNGKIDDVMGWDFFHNNNNPYQNYQGNSHGTHVAGIAGAVGDNNIGITGVAMAVSLMICKGSSSYAPSEGIRDGYGQIQYAAQSRADIINCSWISYTNQGNMPNNVVNYATALGSLVVAGAGNDNVEHTPGFQAYPSDATNAVSVAATTSNDTKANFSDFGNPIDIAAPGVSILSTWRNDGYNSIQGTSMASPVVAGVAALVKTLNPQITPAQLMTRLTSTADNIDDLNPNYRGLLGAGRVNAFRAALSDKIPLLSIYEFFVEEYVGDGDGIPNPGEEVSIVFSLFNEIGWNRANGVNAVLSTEMPGITITNNSVQFPNIDGGSIVFNTVDPFRFSTAPDLLNLNIPFKLTITANEQTDFPFEEAYDVIVRLSLQKVGWPLELVGNSTSPAVITDISGDILNEIVFGDAQGNLHAVKEDKTSLPGFPVNLGSNINAAVAVADLNNNDRVEIVANTASGFINCVDNEGNILFQYNTQGQFRNNPMIVDVNNNGFYEIAAVTFSNPKLFLLHHDGTDYEGFPVNLTHGVISAPTSVDLTGDGNKELIIVTSAGNLHAISVVTATDIPGFPIAVGATSWSGPTIGDVTGNNQPEIVLGTVQGNVHVYDRHGEQVFTRSFGSPIRTDVLVFDLNLDGDNELVFGDMSGRLFVLDGQGNDIAPFPVNVGGAIESTPVIADMTRNRIYDIIFGDAQGYLHSIDLNGNHTPNFPIYLERPFSVSPAIGYVGYLGNPDILIPNQNGYQYIDFKRVIGTIGWGTFKGNMRRTGNNFDMTTVCNDLLEPQISTALTGNYPNPFNPNTAISFNIGDTSAGVTPAGIHIYNVRGRLVKTLLNENLPAGEYQVFWNGTDDSGQEVSSGIYFYTLRTGEFTATRKMMLMK